MERLTLIEHDAHDATHARVFEATTRGSCIEQLRAWCDRLLADGPPRTFMLSAHPRTGEVVRLAATDDGWGVTVFLYEMTVRRASYATFSDAAQYDFVRVVMGDGNHWYSVEALSRGGDGQGIIRMPMVIAWVRHTAARLDGLIARQVVTEIAVREAMDALSRRDVEGALTALAPTQDTPPAPLMTAIQGMAQFLAEVADEEPAGYVTALVRHAQSVTVAAGIRPDRESRAPTADRESLAA